MMTIIKKSMEIKLAGSLFCVLGIAFLVLSVSFNHIHKSQINELILQSSENTAAPGSISTGNNQIKTKSIAGKLIGIGVGCFVVVLIIMGSVFRFVFLNPLANITKNLNDSTQDDERDLTFRLNLKREDEIGILAKCFDAFIANLDEIILSIGSKTETVSAVSSEVFLSSEQMDEESSDLHGRSNSVAAAAEEMNASMHTVAAASEEASTNISLVAEAAGQMQSNISGVAQNCDEASAVSNSARKQVDLASDKVDHLGDSAKEISKVTQVITEIAEQTNLLALNATIEAARAGDAGKGFAVVASEIKSLALQTAEATQNIREKIESIQNSTKDTVDEVGNISEVILNVDQIVQEIAEAVQEQSHTASEVANNIEQASIGISEVNENVAQSSQVASEIATDISRVDGIASEMSDRASNMTNGARDLDDLSSTLRKMLSVFSVSLNRTMKDDLSSTSENKVLDLMPWSSLLQLGIEEIDNQHKELVRMVNLLHKSMRTRKGSAEVGGILNDLAEYTVFHFSFEEQLFKKYKYAEYENHKKAHEELIEQVISFQNDFKSGKATVTMDLMDFLTDWLKNHIMKTDLAYVSFLKEKMQHV